MLKLPKGITRTFGKCVLWTKRHLPEILTYGGIGATVGGTALMCRATLKSDKVLTEAREADTKEARKKARLEVVKNYALPIAVEGAGIGMIIGGHHTLRKENLVLAASNAAISAAFAKYRKNVQDGIGKDAEAEIFRGSKVVGRDGQTNAPIEPNETPVSIYTAWFDESNPNWSNDPEQNIMFLKRKEAELTNKLRARGYLFLNEGLDDLDIDRTYSGQYVGWVDSMTGGDQFVDFGLYDENGKYAKQLFTGEAILLDFNVDGDIMYILGENVIRNIREER